MTSVRHRSVARIAAFVTGALTIALVVFHAALFYQRIADATIANAGVLTRWIGSFVLLGVFFAARRKYAASVSRRHLGLAFWLVVLLLHAAIPADERIIGSAEDLVATLELTLTVAPALGLLAIAGITTPRPLQVGWLASTLAVSPVRRRDRRYPPRSPPV